MAWPAIIAAAAALGSSLIASRSSKKQAEKTAAANKELAEYSYQKDLEMWNRQNEYNAPAAQMARLKEAGLNSQLVYGSGAPGNSSGPMPRYQAPNVDLHFTPFQIPQMLAQYQDFEMKQAQIDNVKAQTDNTEKRTINESIRSWLLDLQGKTGEFDLDRRQELAPHQLEVAKGEARKVPAEVERSFQSLMNMRRDELNKLLEAQSREKQLTQQDVELEIKRADALYKRYQNDWMKAGITTGDNPLLRIFVRMANSLGFDVDNIGEGIKDLIPSTGRFIPH